MKRHGFTLIELMIVVAIIGILASMAMPTFSLYKDRVYEAEATTVIGALHQGAVAYFTEEHVLRGVAATDIEMSGCIVAQDMQPDAGVLVASVPGSKNLVPFSTSASFKALGVADDDFYQHTFFIAGDADCDLGFYGLGRLPDGVAIQSLIAVRKVGDDAYKVGATVQYTNKGQLVRSGGVSWYGPMPLSEIGPVVMSLGGG